MSAIRRTFFSVRFCALALIVTAGCLRSWTHPAVYRSAAWVVSLAVLGILRYASRVYAAAGSYCFLPPRLDWQKQIVLITGGGAGIGALLAKKIALRNATVVILDIQQPREPVANDNVHFYLCDVSDYKTVQASAQKIRNEVGDPTILINNAGMFQGKLLLDLTEEDIVKSYGVNTLAHYWTLKAFLPAMLRKGTGHIVTVASVMGITGTAQMTDYCGSKAALINLHQSLRFELDNRYHTPQIRTTLLLPALISTPLFSRARMPHSSSILGAFFCPPLAPITVVNALISAMDADEGRVIRLPFYAELIRFLNVSFGLLPKCLVDLVQWVSGADHAMRDYGPKPDAGERLQAERLGRKEM